MCEQENMLTSEQAADHLKISVGALMQYTFRREIEYYKIGRRNYYTLEGLEKFATARIKHRPAQRKPALAHK